LPVVTWFHINRYRINTANPRVCIVAAINALLLLAVAFMAVAGTYANIVSIVANAASGIGRPFSCKDNSA
jgi:hypothetical protein